MTYNCIWNLNRIEIAAAIPNDFTQSYLYGLRDQNMILDGDETYLTPTTYNIEYSRRVQYDWHIDEHIYVVLWSIEL